MIELSVYAGLFLAALLAATVLPMQSEALLVGLLLTGDYPVAALLVTASLGNVLGAVLNWLLGRGLERFRDRRWFPVRAARLEQALAWYHRWGRWSLLLSWAPIIGDPLTLAAGVLREPLPSFLILVTVAKVGRYLIVAGLTLAWFG